MKRIAQKMVENGGVAPGLVTEDFEFTVEAHPSSHPAAGRPHPASEILSGLESAKEVFRYPDEYGPGDGFKNIIRSMTAGHGSQFSRRGPHQGHAGNRHPRADPNPGRHHAAPG
jgi:hypothetical protein